MSNDHTGVRTLLEHYRRIANSATLDDAHRIEGYMAEMWQRDAGAMADRLCEDLFDAVAMGRPVA